MSLTVTRLCQVSIRILGTLACAVASVTLFGFAVPGDVNAQEFTKSITPWPLIPDPPKSKVEWISADMRVNGLPMKVLKFESSVALEELVAYYRAHWDAADGAIVANVDGKRQTILVTQPESGSVVISKFHGPFFMTVKAKRDKLATTSGTMTVSLMAGNQPNMDASDIPHPARAKVISLVESADYGKISKTAMFVVDDSVAHVEFYYSKNLPSNNWQLVDRHASKERLNGQTAYVLMLKKADEELEVVIAAVKGKRTTTFRVNRIKAASGAR